jgi:hypothetical protein
MLCGVKRSEYIQKQQILNFNPHKINKKNGRFSSHFILALVAERVVLSKNGLHFHVLI